MPGKSDPEDFKNVEERFKLSLLNMEKRFVELEMAISDIDEKVKSGRMDSMKELNQRMADIEDLIMVEQAGIVELKGMLERADAKFANVSQFDESLEKRVSEKVAAVEGALKKMEKDIGKPSELADEAKERISLVEKDIAQLKTRPQPESVNPLDIGELKSRTQELGKKLAQLESSVGGLQASMDVKIRNLVEDGLKGATGKGVDFEFIKAKMDSLKAASDSLSDKMSAVDLKLGEIDGKVGVLESKVRENPRKMLDEINSTKRDVETAKIRMESVERVVRELTSNVNEVDDRTKKFQSLEQLTNLKKDVDEKLRKFKDTENEIGKLSNRIEIIYDDLDKRMNSVKGYDKDIRRLSESAKDFVKDLEQVRVDIKSKADRGDVEKSMRQSKNENVLDRFEQELSAIRIDLDATKSLLKENSVMDVDKSELESVRKQLSCIADIEKRIDEISRKSGEIEKSIEKSVSPDIKDIERILKSAEHISKNAAHRKEVDALRKEIEVLKRAKNEKPEQLPDGFKVMATEIGARMSDIEKAISFLQSSLKDINQNTASPYEGNMKELMNKLIFLESRLSAIESMMNRPRPIILE